MKKEVAGGEGARRVGEKRGMRKESRLGKTFVLGVTRKTQGLRVRGHDYELKVNLPSAGYPKKKKSKSK